MMRISLGYPDAENEKRILLNNSQGIKDKQVKNLLSPELVVEAQDYVSKIEVDEKIIDYIVRLSTAVKQHNEVIQAVSPRGTIALMRAAQALAFLKGKDFVTIDMIKNVAPEVLGHRIALKRAMRMTDRSANSEWFSCEILQKVNV
jgi:MoxR-like ATPase